MFLIVFATIAIVYLYLVAAVEADIKWQHNFSNNSKQKAKLPSLAPDDSSTAIQSNNDSAIKNDNTYLSKNDWQAGFGLTHNPAIDSIWFKPVRFYINNPKCSPTAISFYYGQFRSTDDTATANLLRLITTNDAELRPFYRWCLNKTIQIQDGALAEYTGVPARQYAEEYPEEFFQYMDIDSTLQKYNDWVAAISYSGFYDNDDYKQSSAIRRRMASAMKQNCNINDQTMRNSIDKLTMACFP